MASDSVDIFVIGGGINGASVARDAVGRGYSVALAENWKQALVASLIKLIVHPALAYVLMIWVLHVPMDIARYGILLSAMPAGVNVYIFATYYNRAASVAANTILIATVASAATISAWLWVLSL